MSRCTHGRAISLTEEMIMNTDYLPLYMDETWHRYRIEYGFECACPEGVIYLPPNVEPEFIENILNGVLNETPKED